MTKERINKKGMQQPIALPTFLWRPDRVNGIPIFREIFPFKADKPLALRHDHENPNLRPIISTYK